MAELKERRAPENPLERYVRVLEILAAFPSGLIQSDVEKALGLPKTTTNRLLKGLMKSSLVARSNENPAAYILGRRLIHLLHLGAPDEWLERVTDTNLRELADSTGETCFLAKLFGHDVRSVAMQAPDSRSRAYVIPGREMPPHATASAKAILAFQTPELVRSVLGRPLPKLTPRTKTSLSEVMKELAAVRKSGHATCVDEDIEGFSAIACPVNVENVGVMYSVGLTGPTDRLIRNSLESYVPKLQRCAEKIAFALERGDTRGLS